MEDRPKTSPPIDWGAEIRCYMRDPDGHLIEVGQATGIFRIKPFEEESEEDFEEAMNSILRPTFYTSQAAVAEMRRRGGGAIVSVGSMWAVDAISTTQTSAYSAAQAGRHALTKNLAIELAGRISG